MKKAPLIQGDLFADERQRPRPGVGAAAGVIGGDLDLVGQRGRTVR